MLPAETAPKIQKAAISGRPFSDCQSQSGLGALDVLCLPALGAFDHVKLDLLSFLEAAEAGRLNRGEMYEYILSILAADETIALGVVKPLHCSCFHVDAMFLYLM
jgi:hypothetical protein